MSFISAGPAQRVLVAHGEPTLHDLITTRLCLSGYQVAAARTGRQTLEALEAGRPHVLVLDAELPGLKGVEVLAWMNRTGAIQRTAVMMLSPAPRLQEAQEAVRLGASDYMGQRFHEEALLLRVKRLVSRGCAPLNAAPAETVLI